MAELKNRIIFALNEVKDVEALKDLEQKFLSRKGELSQVLRGLKNLSDNERKEMGRIANEIKREVLDKLREAKNRLSGKEEGQYIDVTLPGEKIERGHTHPISQVWYELEDLFSAMGFIILDGPELESDHYNFETLNIPRHHPARDMQDTFFIDPGSVKTSADKQKNKAGEYDMVMRTHTSPMQVRALERYGAPLKCVVPGRVYRNEATDAVHEHSLHQIEGLMVGEDISIANLVAILKAMLEGIFKREIKIRVRPGYFPFVEPGLEIDMQCTICGGKKCPSCKHSGWLEMLGSGMVHPNVLRAAGVDPEKYSGFAFGLGIDRLVMMKYGINDIRHFMSGDLRFLEQF